MQARRLKTSEFPLYEQFVADHGGVFNSSTWKQHVHGDRLNYYGVFTDRGELCAVFHLYAQTRYGCTFIRNPPFMPHTGLVINNRSQNQANYLSFNKDVLTAFVELLNKLNYSVLSIALPPTVMDTQPFYWNKYKVIPNYTYQRDLSAGDSDLEKQFASSVRNSIKKATKDGVSIELCRDHAVVKQLVKTTFSRREKALNEGALDAILQNVANQQNSFAFVAHWENKPVAVAFCLHDKTACYYLFGGYDHTSTHRGAGVLCIYNCLLHAETLDLKRFDFEGSMMPEVESYFRSFGPHMVPYYTVNKGRLPFELVLKFVKRERF